MNVILDVVPNGFNLIEAWGYEIKEHTRAFEVEVPRYNIFGDRLPDISREVIKYRIRYQHGNAIKFFKSLVDAHEYIKKHKLTQVLHTHGGTL